MVSKTHKMSRLQKWLLAVGGVLTAGLVFVVATYLALNIWPNLGAQAIDLGRKVVGDPIIAEFENIVLQTQDKINQLKYNLSSYTPVAPWQVSAAPSFSPTPNGAVTKLNKPSQSHLLSQAWAPAPLAPLGTVQSEGQWTAYIQDASGNTVAYRTFLQPDPKRPYALVAVVAFNLQTTQLHFVLGYNEPKSTIKVLRSGRIPASDLQAGVLLAAFNGGFKAQHGHYGVMANGVTLIPPRQGFGTVGIYDDGSVRIGAWGTDITTSPHLIAWRQNGPLIVQDGQINPLTAVHDPAVWGYTIYGLTATYRSALGISRDGRTLYYFAGPDLTLPALAQAVQDAGAYQAIQLDINNYYVHFEAFQPDGNRLVAVPLLNDMQGVGDHRFLTAYDRDFFYLTAK